MTERCQTKLTKKKNNQNYIIYVGIIVALFAILFFHRFHLITIVVSYVLGCVACYYGLNSEILHRFIEKLSCHILRKPPEKREDKVSVKTCNTCGSKDCDRHDPEMSAEPWSGLQVHKQLDQAVEDFYNAILEQFVNSWYSKITQQPFFVDELRHQFRYASSCLLRRALKINYAKFIIDRLIPCALRHYTVCTTNSMKPIHVAASNRDAELKYLRCLTESLLPYLFRTNETQNSIFRVLVKEIFAGWVLLPLTDTLADPYILNTLVVLATNDETMAPLPATPNYEVEFLENFVRRTDSVYAQRAALLRIDLELLISNSEHFYSFMQHLKLTNDIYLLQFYSDIKSFQSQILNPDLSEEEQKQLHSEAVRLFRHYLSAEVPRVAVPPALLDELRTLLDAGPAHVTKLQTSRALYQAARQSHAALEKFMMPKFLHSEEFYKLFIGQRVPTGYQKQNKEPLKQTMSRSGNRLKNIIKSQIIDGQIIDSFDSDLSESDSIDNLDLLKHLQSLAAEELQSEQDLSTYKVVLTDVEIQTYPGRSPARVFTVTVHRVVADGAAGLWTFLRSEHDFHLLRSKLIEFHGETLLADLQLPSRRDNSPLETLRYKYEDFLQRLLQIKLLQTSNLLYIFLTVEGNFSKAVQDAMTAADSIGSDYGHIYQSVAHKLRKEKGQHLETFLWNFLVSTDKERYQVLKQGREVEEAHEVIEEEVRELVVKRQNNVRNIKNGVFGNNFDIAPAIIQMDREYQTAVTGFTQCFMYLLLKVVKLSGFITGIIGSLLGMTRGLLDEMIERLLDIKLRELLSERRLAHLIRLGHEVVFTKKSSHRVSAETQRARAGAGVSRRLPYVAAVGAPLLALLQHPHLNKQLVYNLLDLCVLELFPELRNKEMNETKS